MTNVQTDSQLPFCPQAPTREARLEILLDWPIHHIRI